MKTARELERKSKFAAAVAMYDEATGLTEAVSPDLRRQAKIAVHNRLAACYMKMHANDHAVSEFQRSVELGDVQYAPKYLSKLRNASSNKTVAR